VFKLTPTSGGWRQTVLHAFHGFADGSQPFASLVFDAVGNLYGTTSAGGPQGGGTVFELTPNSGVAWKETVLYAFTGGTDGRTPVASVVFDTLGHLYGSTSNGGNTSCSSQGCGTVFELLPISGKWIERVPHIFTGGKDGIYLDAGLTLDEAGNLYGTTNGGGSHGNGTVFKIASTARGWKESVLHNFTETGKDGGERPLE
jgi:uncharacterized repeat protein (TIGR03803 family)